MDVIPHPGHRPRRVAIVGAGASGTLAAAALSRAASAAAVDLDLQLIDRRALGRGVAYGTRDPAHRLNVPAGLMSGLAEDPDHFVRWSRSAGKAIEPGDFAERRWYGTYLRTLLRHARAAAPPGVSLTSRIGTVSRLTGCAGGPLTVTLADGRRLLVDAAVLALGNPAPPAIAALGTSARVVHDPWAPGALERVGTAARSVLLVGTGLTMVDVALTLSRRCPGARLTAISRHGLLPRPHSLCCEPPRDPVVEPRPGLTLDEVAATLKREIDRDPRRWRAVVDGLRPATRDIWATLSLDDRRRFLDEYARVWEVCRHRTPPAVTAELRALTRSGRLAVRRGQIRERPRQGRGGLVVSVDDDGHASRVGADWVVNCTGPDLRLDHSSDPFVRDLLGSGRARPHPLGLGLDVDHAGRVLDASGRPDPRLLALGPLRRGALLETTAVPEIREQAAEAAGLLLGRGAQRYAQGSPAQVSGGPGFHFGNGA